MFSVDVNRRLVTYNEAFADNVLQTWGTSVAPGKTAFHLFPPDRAELWTELFSRAFAEGLLLTRLQDPGDRWFEFTLIPIHEDGAIGGVSVFGKEITERNRPRPPCRTANSDGTIRVQLTTPPSAGASRLKRLRMFATSAS